MPRTVTIESLPQAFEVIKQMQDQGYDWGEDYRCAAPRWRPGVNHIFKLAPYWLPMIASVKDDHKHPV